MQWTWDSFGMDCRMMPIDQLFHLYRFREKVAVMAGCIELTVLSREAERKYQQRQSYYSKDSGNLSERVQSI